MTTVDTYKNSNNGKKVSIVKIVKPGTQRVFFFPLTSDGKRLNRTFYSRKYDAVTLGKIYLNN